MDAVDKQLDAAFSKYVKKRDGKCVACGSRANLECAHVFGCGARSVRWNPLNAVTLCRECHAHDHQDDPRLAMRVAQERLTEHEWERLVRLQGQIVHWTVDDKKELLAWLKL